MSFSAKSIDSIDLEKIVGGQNVTIEQFPWQVSLFNATSGRHFCGGSIIDRFTILTAAHCIRPGRPVSVRVGTTFHREGGSIHESSRIIVHPAYDRSTFDSDLALVILKYPLIYNQFVQPVALPEFDYDLDNNSSVLVSGWGFRKIANETTLPEHLQAVEVHVIDQDRCADSYQTDDHTFDITDNMFCAGVENVGGKDSCQVSFQHFKNLAVLIYIFEL